MQRGWAGPKNEGGPTLGRLQHQFQRSPTPPLLPNCPHASWCSIRVAPYPRGAAVLFAAQTALTDVLESGPDNAECGDGEHEREAARCAVISSACPLGRRQPHGCQQHPAPNAGAAGGICTGRRTGQAGCRHTRVSSGAAPPACASPPPPRPAPPLTLALLAGWLVAGCVQPAVCAAPETRFDAFAPSSNGAAHAGARPVLHAASLEQQLRTPPQVYARSTSTNRLRIFSGTSNRSLAQVLLRAAAAAETPVPGQLTAWWAHPLMCFSGCSAAGSCLLPWIGTGADKDQTVCGWGDLCPGGREHPRLRRLPHPAHQPTRERQHHGAAGHH